MHYLQEYFTPEPNSGCWLWDGYVDKDGYGRIKTGGVTWQAHRYVYHLEQGAIPDGLLFCQTGDVTCCVNPAHLFLGTCADNLADMAAKGKYRNNSDMRDFCPNGHLRTEENTYLYRGKRLCRECRMINEQDRRARGAHE
jgi:hypothetical protein